MSLVYLVTEARFVSPTDPDWYIEQILLEDRLLSERLEQYGIRTERVDWADPNIDWNKADAAVIRTTWDYFSRYDEFSKWMDTVRSIIPLINTPELLRWNLDKHYLLDLKANGFSIVPSIFIELGDTRSLREIYDSSGWKEVILKPCVSGAARHTYRLDQRNLSEYEPIFKELIQNESMMLQQFHDTILDKGEVSHMVMGGRYTHSILKRGKGDDFRVQDDFGGTVHPYEATEEERLLAEKVFSSCSSMPVYGRLDIMWDAEGRPMISELEIIEPELWLREHPSSAEDLAEGISAALLEMGL